jgi:two-component system, chemotaxis family, chemotaxis protein CheV
MENVNKSGILTETGTGEVEILHFKVKGEHYAINVVKVKEILNIENLSRVPNSHPAVAGLSLIRGEVISVIDMRKVLENESNQNIKRSMILVCEFNNLKVAFAIDEVLGISRITWKQIQEPDSITGNTLVIGNINLNSRILMLLDFEKIVMDISPQAGINVDRLKDSQIGKDRSSYRILLADDSPLIREVLKNTLTKAGITRLEFFNDGQSALDYMIDLYEKRGDEFINEINLVITDIEMPKLDGHTFTRKLKEHRGLRKVPVIIFSSLITGDLRHKGESVGADAQMSKPEVGKLVDLIDEFLEIVKG